MKLKFLFLIFSFSITLGVVSNLSSDEIKINTETKTAISITKAQILTKNFITIRRLKNERRQTEYC